MLQKIRSMTTGWIAWIIIGFICLTFGLFGIHQYFAGNAQGKVIAKVNGDPIYYNQLSNNYQQLRQQVITMSKQYSFSPEQEQALKLRVLRDLVKHDILVQAIDSQGFNASQELVWSFIKQMPVFQQDGQFSEALFQRVLANQEAGKDFFSEIKTIQLINQVQTGFVASSFALPSEVNAALKLYNQSRDVSYFTIDPKQFANEDKSVTAEQEQAYYNKHQDVFTVPEQVSLSYVELSIANIAKNITPTDEELQKYYQSHSSSFNTPARWKLQQIAIPIQENDLAAAQKIADNVISDYKQYHSLISLQNHFSKIQVQDANKAQWLTESQMNSRLVDALSSMSKTNDISPAIHAGNHLVIYRLLDKKESVNETFDMAKDKVKQAVVQAKAQEVFSDEASKLANISYEQPDSLAPVAKELGLTVQSTGPFSKNTVDGKGILANPSVVATAFSNAVLTQKMNSRVITLNDNAQLVVRVKEVHPEHVKSLAEVKSQIHDLLLSQFEKEQALKMVDNITSQVKAGISADKIVDQTDAKYQDLGYITRSDSKIDAAIITEGFALPRPGSNPSAGGTMLSNGLLAVVMVSHVKDSDVSAKEQKSQHDAIAKQLVNNMGSLDYQLYENSLMNNANVNIESSNWVDVDSKALLSN